MENIKRILQQEIEQRIRPSKVALIFGARRVGKTVLLREILSNYSGRTLLLNGESLDTMKMLEERTITNYRQLFEGIDLLAIDEAQHIREIGLKLKLIVDEVPGIAVIATGSSSFDLQNQAGEPLVGRSAQFLLTPLSIREIASKFSGFEIKINIDNHLVYGLYPELLSLPNLREKQEYLEDMVNAYLLKDILAIDGVKNASKLHNLLKLIAYQIGSEVSLDEIGKDLSISRNSVARYLDLLQKAFVVFPLGGYSSNLRKEVTKSSKWYFYDNGIRNALLNDFKTFKERSDQERGALWENFIIGERLKRIKNNRLRTNQYFWRTYDKQEIDLIEEDNQLIKGFEMKAGSKVAKAPMAFARNYPNATVETVNHVHFLPFIILNTNILLRFEGSPIQTFLVSTS